MLYTCTRNPSITYTARKALADARTPDGGFFVPASGESLGGDLMGALSGSPFNHTVAVVLNRLWDTRLSAHDVRLAAGRSPVRLTALANRILVGECWHNLEGEYNRLVQNITAHFCPDASQTSGSWGGISVGIAVLFGIFGELMGKGMASADKKVDVSLLSADFSLAMSAWYARKWGLPIGNIICCCNENNGVWNLFTHGMLRTDGISLITYTPRADVAVPASLERLIYECGGAEETALYVSRVRKGESYYPNDAMLQRIRRGMYVSVVSTPRMMDIIPNAYTTHNYLFSPYSALAYGGLLDYRAVTGESRRSLILAEETPANYSDVMAKALNIDPAMLSNYIS